MAILHTIICNRLRCGADLTNSKVLISDKDSADNRRDTVFSEEFVPRLKFRPERLVNVSGSTRMWSI